MPKLCFQGYFCTCGHVNRTSGMLFSTTIVRLMQVFSIRQPLASTWLRARRYTPTIPYRSPDSDHWSFIGQNAANKKTSPSTADEKWQQKSETAKANLSDRPPANAYTGHDILVIYNPIYLNCVYPIGRTVPVKSGNVAEAYQKLHNILQRNRVRPQLRLAARHEKKGVKRRRLSSERWRRQFAHEVSQFSTMKATHP